MKQRLKIRQKTFLSLHILIILSALRFLTRAEKNFLFIMFIRYIITEVLFLINSVNVHKFEDITMVVIGF